MTGARPDVGNCPNILAPSHHSVKGRGESLRPGTTGKLYTQRAWLRGVAGKEKVEGNGPDITRGVLEHKWRASLKLHYC